MIKQLQLLLVLLVITQGYVLRDYNPLPDPKAVVKSANARFTVLTSTLVRMEYSREGEFDDRPTIQVVNRMLPVPQFSVTNKDDSLEIITESLKITYLPGNSTPGDTCLNPKSNTDQVGGSRVPNYPNGYVAGTQADCCGACNKDSHCTSWVYEPNHPSGSVDCWLMDGVTGTTGASDRVFGGYNGPIGFNSNNLRVELKVDGKPVIWSPGTKNLKNLGGTISALDCYSTKEQCTKQYWENMGEGLLTTDGWYVLDDTDTARYDSNLTPNIAGADIPWFNETLIDNTDLYFFGDGLNYPDTIKNYGLIGGTPAIPPRAAFGMWWSRYYAYSEQQFIDEVLSGYRNNSLPLSVAVLDMDWHTEENLPGCDTWGGYTFNTKLFPNPQQFVASLHSSNNILGHAVKMSLNLHPQSGVDHCQAKYPEFAKAMGVNPATNQTIACNFGDPNFASNVFSIFLDAQPLTLINYWWTDYGGCGGPSDRSLYWSNYIFDSHAQLARQERPLVLSRYGGLGSHRLPIGFSGDTFQAFMTLEFEVQMTQMAANVLFGYWSHDIGGFHSGNGSPGDSDPKNLTGSEMFLRWTQFGAVAPIARTHCDHCERRIWVFPHFPWMKAAFVLRNALVPYIYTFARYTFETGIALIRPLYYESPSAPEAYTFDKQYLFGSSIVAAPITSVSDANTHTLSKPVWLPEGTWASWNGTETWKGPMTVTKTYGVQDIPLFVRAGSVIPLQTFDSVISPYADPVMWTIFPGASTGSGQIYEDDSDNLDYLQDKFATTAVKYVMSDTKTTVTVFPTTGTFSSLPQQRGHIVQIRGVGTPKSVTANGDVIPHGMTVPGWYVATEYGLDITEGAVVINVGKYSVKSTVSVDVTF